VFGQVAYFDFNTDHCQSSTCQLNLDLINNNCIKSHNQLSQIYSLGGFNKVTDICDTRLGYSGYQSMNLGGNDRKVIMQKHGRVCKPGFLECQDLGVPEGIFAEIPKIGLKSNIYYKMNYDLMQIWPLPCAPNLTANFLYPVIAAYYLNTDDPSTQFVANNNTHNLNIINSSNPNILTLLGLLTAADNIQGVTVTSPTYRFANYQDESTNHKMQIGFYIQGFTGGTCELDSDPPGLMDPENLVTVFASTLDNVIIDCDDLNIKFNLDVKVCSPTQLNDCNGKKYCAEISTLCENINYFEYPYSIQVLSNNIVVKTINGTGQNTKFDLDDLPTGFYSFKLIYDTSTGRNIKVMFDNNNLETQPVFHDNNAPYYIDGNQTFNTTAYTSKNIIVNSGGSLTVNDYIYFKDGTSLIVEPGGALIVQGNGHLTACENQWEGVRSYDDANVKVINQGTISMAKVGIFSTGDGPTETVLNQAHFLNNGTGLAAFYASKPIILNSHFSGGIRGVYLNDVTGGTTANGVLFEGNTFSYQTKQGIIAYNTGINVINGNQFTGCDEGIGIRNLFGNPQQGIIGDNNSNSISNLFTSCDRGIYSNAGTQFLTNNNFSNNGFGGYYSGINFIFSQTNSFNGGHAEAFYSTGANSSISERNDYNSDAGIFTWQNNDNYVFKSNCFSTQWYDVNSWGTINGAQGDAGVAASNCFTGASVPDFYCNTSNTVDYFIPKPTVTYPNCLVPISAGNYSSLFLSDTENSGQCGTTSGIVPIGEYDYIRAMGCNGSLIAAHILYLKSAIQPLLTKQSNGTITIQERATLAWMQRHLRFTITQWAWCLNKAKNFNQLYEWYKVQDEKDYDVLAVETKILMGLYSEAIDELDSIVQKYNLNNALHEALLLNIRAIRTDLGTPTFSTNEIILLRNVAAMSDPLAAYGRALLYKLTDEKIEPVVTGQIIPRNRVDNQVEESEIYLVYPNPVADLLYIDIQNMDQDSNYKYQITNLYGTIMHKSTEIQNTKISVNDLQSGIYIMQIFKNDQVSYTSKFVIVH